jgi:hypothetical protein
MPDSSVDGSHGVMPHVVVGGYFCTVGGYFCTVGGYFST